MSIRNSVKLIGHFGETPELKTVNDGKNVVNFSIATNEKFSTDSGVHEDTQWHRCVAWGKTAENIAKLCGKGSQAAVEGKLSYNEYLDKNGVKRYTADIIVESFIVF